MNKYVCVSVSLFTLGKILSMFIDRVDVNQLYGITLDATQSFFSYKISYFKATVKKVKIKSNKNK